MMMICAVGLIYFFHDPHMKSRLQQLVSNQIEGEWNNWIHHHCNKNFGPVALQRFMENLINPNLQLTKSCHQHKLYILYINIPVLINFTFSPSNSAEYHLCR